MVVVDASAIASIFLPERQSAAAAHLLSGRYELFAPDHLLVEVYSVMLRALRRGRASADDVAGSLADFRSTPIAYLASHLYLDAAFAMAQRRGGSVYDALYVVAAAEHGVAVVTRDARLAEMARGERVAVTMVSELPLH